MLTASRILQPAQPMLDQFEWNKPSRSGMGGMKHPKCWLPLVALTLVACIADIHPQTSDSGSNKIDSNRIIQYRGPIPLLGKDKWAKEVELKFELYRSPTGGIPFWTEKRKVAVRVDGWVSIDLGQVQALPDEALNSPFRFLSIWSGSSEFVPRKQVASVAYIASTQPGETPYIPARSSNQATLNSNPAHSKPTQPIGRLVTFKGYKMEAEPRTASSWLEASELASRKQATLPSFEEWYNAFEAPNGHELKGMTGHYEWVIPWVYEPAIHGRLHEHYRNKTAACYYNELSPQNLYPFRLRIPTEPTQQPKD